jgi:multiple sugar transport system substrate-binding protein
LNLSRSTPLWRVIAVVTALLTSTLSACGPSTPEEGPIPSGPTPTVTVPVDLPVTIALAGRFTSQALAVLDEQLGDFQAANPDVRIEIVRAPKDAASRREWLAARLGEGDNSIDLLLLDATWPAEFAADGGLAPLDDHLAAQGVETSAFLPATLQANTIDGQLTALPWSADGGLLYYRRDLLDKYGYSPPTNWANLQEITLDIKAREGLPYGFVWHGATDENLTCNTLEYVWSHGGDVLDEAGKVTFDSPESRAGLQQMKDLVRSGASPQDVAALDRWQALTAFKDGQAVFMRNWFDVWDYLNSEDSSVTGQVGVTALPASCLGGQSLALSAYSLHPHQAMRLMAFMVGYDQQVELAKSASQPPALQAAYHDENLLASAPLFETLHAVFSAARARPSVAPYVSLSEAIYTEVNRLLAGEQDVDATAANIQRRIEAAHQ